MKLFQKLRAVLTAHTVDTKQGVMAGYEVRDTASRKILGYVWAAGTSWRWKHDDNGGERSTQLAAVTVLRDIYDLASSGCAQPSRLQLLDVDDDDRDSLDEHVDATIAAAPVKRQQPRAAAPAPARRHVVWGDSATAVPDLTAAIASALNRQHKETK